MRQSLFRQTSKTTPPPSEDIVIDDPNDHYRLEVIEIAKASFDRARRAADTTLTPETLRELTGAATRLNDTVEAHPDLPRDLIIHVLAGKTVTLRPEPEAEAQRAAVTLVESAWGGAEWECTAGQTQRPIGCQRHAHHYYCETCNGHFGTPHDGVHTGSRAHVIGGTFDRLCACTPCKIQTGRPLAK